MNLIEVLNLSPEEVNRAVIWYAFAVFPEGKPQPDWVRCIANINVDGLKDHLRCILDLAIGALEEDLEEAQNES